MIKKNNFNNFRFEGLEHKECSNKYFTMKRVSEDENKIVVKVADSHLIKTKYGYALILDHNHVVFLKEWQVNQNYFGNEVLLQKEYFNVKEWGKHEDFFKNDEFLNFDAWLKVAYEQENATDEETGFKPNPVRWEK